MEPKSKKRYVARREVNSSFTSNYKFKFRVCFCFVFRRLSNSPSTQKPEEPKLVKEFLCVIACTFKGELRQYLIKTDESSVFTHYCRIRKLPQQLSWDTLDIVQAGELDFLIRKRLKFYKCEVRKIISGELVATIDCVNVLNILGTSDAKPVLIVKEAWEKTAEKDRSSRKLSFAQFEYSNNELHQTCKTWKEHQGQSFDYMFMYKGKLFGYRDNCIVVADALQTHVQNEVEVPGTIVAFARKGKLLAVIYPISTPKAELTRLRMPRMGPHEAEYAGGWFFDLDQLVEFSIEGRQSNYTLATVTFDDAHCRE